METHATSVGAARGCWRKCLTARPLFTSRSRGPVPHPRDLWLVRTGAVPGLRLLPHLSAQALVYLPLSHSLTLWTGSLLKPKRPIGRRWDGRVRNYRPLTPEHQIPSAATENANTREVVPARNRTRFVPLIIPLKRSLPLLLAERKSAEHLLQNRALER